MLSLDAPVVVILWQWLFACAVGVELRWPLAFVLGVSVWLAYVADRWFEGWRLTPDRIRTVRHRFYQRHRRSVAAVWLVVFTADLEVAIARLDRHELLAGLILLAPVLAYLLSHQFMHRHHPWRAPKEICVATLLGCGAAVFIIAQPGATWARLIEPFSLFTALCFANVALISTWEYEVDLVHGETSLARQFSSGAAISHVFPWAIGAIAAVLSSTETDGARAAALCTAGSSLVLGFLDRAEPRLGWRLAHVMADVALLTPLVPLVVAHSR